MPTDNPALKDMVCVGAVGGAYGVRGQVRLKSYCAQPEAIAAYSPLRAEDGRSFEVRLGASVKAGFAADLTGVSTKEEAEALKGLQLYALRSQLPDPDEDEFYHVDLIGLAVMDTGGNRIGRVKAVFEASTGDLLEIAVDGNSEPALVPFTRAVVPTVDISGGRIVLDPPEGLLPD